MNKLLLTAYCLLLTAYCLVAQPLTATFYSPPSSGPLIDTSFDFERQYMVTNSTATPYFFKSTIEIEKFDNGIWINALRVVEDSLPVFTIEPFDTIYYSVIGNENSTHLEINDPTIQNLINNNTFYLDNGYRFRLQPSYSNDGVTWFNTMPEITHEIMSNPATPITFLNKNQNDSISLNAESMVFIWEDQNAKSIDSSYYKFTMYPWFPGQPYDSIFTQNEKIVDTNITSSIFIWEVEPIERILQLNEDETIKYVYNVESFFNVGLPGYSNKSDDMVLQGLHIDVPKFIDNNNDTAYTYLIGKKYGMNNELVLNGNLGGEFDLGDPNITIHLPETLQVYPTCNTSNGLMEENTFASFTGKVGKNLSSGIKWEQEGIFYDNTNNITKSNSPHLLVHKNTGNDVFTGLPVVSPEGGNYSVRINGDRVAGDGRVSSLNTKFVVDISQTLVSFRVAPVLMDPSFSTSGHQGLDKAAHPFFQIYATDETTGETIYNTYRVFPGDGIYNWLYTEGGDPTWNYSKIAYLDWQCIDIDVSNRNNHIISINFIVSDCIPKGHFGYMYVDALCPQSTSTASFTLPEYMCPFEDNEVIADGSASTNVSEYMWSIGAWENGDYVAGTYIEQLFRNGTPGEIDLRNLYEANARIFRNYTYKITLKVRGRCQDWVTISKFIYPSPTYEKVLETSYNLCYNNLQEINFNGAIIPSPPTGTTYSWSPSTYLDNPNIANPKFNYTGLQDNISLEYELTINANDPDLCLTKQKLKINIVNLSQVKIIKKFNCESNDCYHELQLVDQNDNILNENVGKVHWYGPYNYYKVTTTNDGIRINPQSTNGNHIVDNQFVFRDEDKDLDYYLIYAYLEINSTCSLSANIDINKSYYSNSYNKLNNKVYQRLPNFVAKTSPLIPLSRFTVISRDYPVQDVIIRPQYSPAYRCICAYKIIFSKPSGEVVYNGSINHNGTYGGYHNYGIYYDIIFKNQKLPTEVYTAYFEPRLCGNTIFKDNTTFTTNKFNWLGIPTKIQVPIFKANVTIFD